MRIFALRAGEMVDQGMDLKLTTTNIMAKQKGIIKLEGKIGDLSFYKSKDGYLAREKGGVDGERIKKDPAFVRTRENGSEFGGSAKSGKLLRDAIRTMMQNASDNRVTSRVTKLMSQICVELTINVLFLADWYPSSDSKHSAQNLAHKVKESGHEIYSENSFC